MVNISLTLSLGCSVATRVILIVSLIFERALPVINICSTFVNATIYMYVVIWDNNLF